MPLHRPGDRQGFSLVEVIVALVVSAIIISGARGLVDGLTSTTRSVVQRADAAERESNAYALLRALARRAEAGTSPERTFAGTPSRASFTSWCDVPGGWQARCRVTLEVDSVPDRHALALSIAGQIERVVIDNTAERLVYLEDANGGGRWFREWGTALTAPLAVGVVRARDTLIVRIGGRG